MNDTLKALAARIKATNKWKARPGQAVRDPSSGQQFRFYCPDSTEDYEMYLSSSGTFVMPALVDEPPLAYEQACKRAIAAGPDLDDVVTALSLLADADIAASRCNDGWRAVYGAAVHWSAAPGECVAHAWLAAHGGQP